MTTNKLTNGEVMVSKMVSTLPSVKESKHGDVVFHTEERKLYINCLGDWIRVVPDK